MALAVQLAGVVMPIISNAMAFINGWRNWRLLSAIGWLFRKAKASALK
jgi:hypothetical protein